MSVLTIFKNYNNRANELRSYWARYKSDDNRNKEKSITELTPETETFRAIPNNFEAEIVDNRINWAMGKSFGIDFFADAEDKIKDIDRQKDQLKLLYRRNRLNVTIKNFGRCLLATGESHLLLYTGDNNEINIKHINPKDSAYFADMDGNLVEYARRWTIQLDNSFYSYCDYYTPDKVERYRTKQSSSYLEAYNDTDFIEKVNEVKNFFGEIPVIIATTDDEARPAFFPVMKLIEAYNLLFTETINQYRAFKASYLILRNYQLTDEQDNKVETDKGRAEAMRAIKNLSVLFMDDNGEAKFLEKQVQTQAFVELEKAIRANIDRFGRNINYADPEVLGRATNLTINTRTKPIDNSANDLDDIIEVSIIEMLEMANNIWAKTGIAVDIDCITPTFSYDKPSNLPEEAQSVQTLINSGVTLQDALTVFSPCEIPEEWAERAKEEKALFIDSFKDEPFAKTNNEDEKQ